MKRANETVPKLAAAEAAAPAAEAAGEYYRRIEAYAHRIRATREVGEIIRLLEEALRETHGLRAGADLVHARERIARAEQQIESLKRELETINALLRVDPLTGALNRRGLEETYAREAARAERHATALSLVLLDLDDFKQINDRFGHEAGDRALVHFVKCARASLRPQDALARIGGEEFVLLLPQTALEAALAAAQRLQRALAHAPVHHGSAKLALAFSAGGVERRAGEALETLLGRADRALYRAKREGKNRTLGAP
jgi:diguanylate cyclase